MNDPVRLDVWSDYVCPFCYLEAPELARLATELGPTVTIVWRAFELRPDPVPTLDPDGEYLHRVWGQSVYPMARERGMTLRLPPVQPRSRTAFEAAAFARSQGRFEAMHQAIFAAFFEHGEDIADRAVLRRLAAGAGLDPAALDRALDDGAFTAGVLADQEMARELGISGVPGSVVSRGGQGLLVSGAQPYPVLRQAVDRLLG